MKTEIKIDDEFTVDFMKNEKGGLPVCKVEGIVGFIGKGNLSFVVPCSTWIVQVKQIEEKYLLVKPLIKVRSPKENELIFAEKLDALRGTKQPRKREHKSFLYKSFQELKK